MTWNDVKEIAMGYSYFVTGLHKASVGRRKKPDDTLWPHMHTHTHLEHLSSMLKDLSLIHSTIKIKL